MDYQAALKKLARFVPEMCVMAFIIILSVGAFNTPSGRDLAKRVSDLFNRTSAAEKRLERLENRVEEQETKIKEAPEPKVVVIERKSNVDKPFAQNDALRERARKLRSEQKTAADNR